MNEVRMTPWGDWNEWGYLRNGLFSSDDAQITQALELVGQPLFIMISLTFSTYR